MQINTLLTSHCTTAKSSSKGCHFQVLNQATNRLPCLKKGGQRTRCIWVAVSAETSSSSFFELTPCSRSKLAKVKDINHNSALLNPISQATQTSKKTCPATATLTANIISQNIPVLQTNFTSDQYILGQIICPKNMTISLCFRTPRDFMPFSKNHIGH